MKAYEFLHSARVWCQHSPARDSRGIKVNTFDSTALQWCALAAIQKTYPPSQWEDKMDRLLRALSVSEAGLSRLTISDKMCCLMEWNDDINCCFSDVREKLVKADL